MTSTGVLAGYGLADMYLDFIIIPFYEGTSDTIYDFV